MFQQILATALFSGSVDFLRQLETSLFQSMQSILPYLPAMHLLTVYHSNHSLTMQLKINDWLTSRSFTGSFLLPVFCIATLVSIHRNLLQFLPELIIILAQRLSVNPCIAKQILFNHLVNTALCASFSCQVQLPNRVHHIWFLVTCWNIV